MNINSEPAKHQHVTIFIMSFLHADVIISLRAPLCLITALNRLQHGIQSFCYLMLISSGNCVCGVQPDSISCRVHQLSCYFGICAVCPSLDIPHMHSHAKVKTPLFLLDPCIESSSGQQKKKYTSCLFHHYIQCSGAALQYETVCHSAPCCSLLDISVDEIFIEKVSNMKHSQ